MTTDTRVESVDMMHPAGWSAGPAVSQDVLVEGGHPTDHSFDAELLFGPTPTFLPEGGPPARVAEQPEDGRGEFVRCLRGYEHPGPAVLDHLRDAAGLGPDDRGA